MKLQPKDQVLLEQAYKSVNEASGTYDGNRLASDAKHFSKAHTGEGPQRMTGPEDYDFLKHKTKGEPLSEPEMKEAMAILDAYAKKIIDAQEAAAKFKDLYQRSSSGAPDAAAHMDRVSTMSKVSPYNK